MEYYLTIKKNETMPFAATCTELEILMLSEVSQRKTNAIWYHIWNLKYDMNELIYETEIGSQTEFKLTVIKGEGSAWGIS